MKKVTKQTFTKGIVTLFIAQVVIKLLGFVYRVIITGMEGFGDIGNSYYGAAFQFYTAILAVSTVGIPAAIAKLVSEKVAVKDFKGAHKIFRVALVLFSVVGIFGSLLTYFGAGYMARWVKNPGVDLSLMSLAPSIFFVAIASVIRGYFQGFCDMRPQANSQVLDQVAKCFFTIWLTWMFIGNNPEVMAAAATFGSTIGTIFSFTYLYIYYKRRQKAIKQDVSLAANMSNESGKRIAVSLFSLSIPIMLGAIITSIAGLVNLFTVMPRLLVAGKTPDDAKILYGMITGKSDTLLNLPLALNIVYATSLVPNVSAALALHDTEGAAKKIAFSIFSTVLITLPAAFGIAALADPIIKMLFPTAPLGGFYIEISAYAVVFIALAQTLGGALQGMGKVAVPAIALFTGAVIKYILNYWLVGIPKINVMGAAYSTIICYFITFLISFIVLNRMIKLDLDYVKCFVKPLVASIIMKFVVEYTYSLTYPVVNSNAVATLIAICAGIFIYGVLVILLRMFSKEELSKLPIAGKIVK